MNLWSAVIISDFFTHSVFWIGLHDHDVEGVYQWVSDNSSVLFEDWDNGQPNGDQLQNCVFMRRMDTLWNDVVCDSTRIYMCEYN